VQRVDPGIGSDDVPADPRDLSRVLSVLELVTKISALGSPALGSVSKRKTLIIKGG
jgi:hypothetical protein